MKEVYQYLKENSPIFYLATVDGNLPKVRPFGAIAIYNDKLYITTNNKKDVFNQMIKNPKIEISGCGKDGTWLRLSATVVHDSDRAARVQMLEENPSLNKMYNADDSVMEVLYLKDATATFCSFTESPRTITF